MTGSHTAGHTATSTLRAGGTSGGTAKKTGTSGKTKKYDKDANIATNFIDPLCVKAWNRKLGILYYGSDLPVECQQACLRGVSYLIQQRQCNQLIDVVVRQQALSLLAQ